MIQELLVMLACAQNSGCTETTNAYYATNPAVKERIKHGERKVKTLAGPTAVALSPIVIFTVKKQATINLNKYFSLQIDRKQDSIILLKFSF